MDFEKALQEASLVKNLTYTKHHLRTLDDKIGEFINLEVLSINRNSLKSLPDSFGQLAHLRELFMNKNYFTALPEVLFENKNMETFVAKHNRIKVISPNIAQWQSLQTLDLRDNLLQTLPVALGQLPCLKNVSLQKNPTLDLTQAIEVLTQLPTGLHLNLQECDIHQLPDNFKKLDNLVSLDISFNSELDLDHLVKALTSLKNLRSLIIYQYGSTKKSLPLSFKNLRHLESLQMWAFQNIEEILPVFTQLKSLNISDLKEILSGEFPAWILPFKNLESLHLDHNAFKHIPAEITQLTQLRHLNICRHAMKEIPDELMEILPQLETLSFTESDTPRFKEQQQFLDQLKALTNISKNTLNIAFRLYKKRYSQALASLTNPVEMLSLLDLKMPFMKRAALALLEKYLTQQGIGSLAAGNILFLAGKVKQYEAKAVKKALKTLGIKVSSKLNNQVTHIVLATDLKDKKEAIVQHLSQYPTTQLFTEGLLQQWYIEQTATPYDWNEQAIHNIQQLLFSNDSKNLLVALSIIENQSIPTALYADIIALRTYYQEDVTLQKAFEKVFWRKIPTFLQMLVLGQIYHYSYASSWENLPIDSIAQIEQNFPAFSVKRYVNYAYKYKKLGLPYILKHGGMWFDDVLQTLSLQGSPLRPSDKLTIDFDPKQISPQIQAATHIKQIAYNLYYASKEVVFTMPEGLGLLPNVVNIELNCCYIEKLPKDFALFKKLKDLKIWYSHLSEVPELIAQLTGLIKLEISNAKIEQISEAILPLKQLQVLNLNSNQLRVLPTWFGQMTSLNTLNLYGNQLSSL